MILLQAKHRLLPVSITVLIQLQTMHHLKIDFIGLIHDTIGCDRLKD